MNEAIIKNVTSDFIDMIPTDLKDILVQCILFGSCARGDYDEESDIDMALIVKVDREQAEGYTDCIIDVVAELAIKYMVVVNAICIPYEEYISKKSWYDFYANIDREGNKIYG